MTVHKNHSRSDRIVWSQIFLKIFLIFFIVYLSNNGVIDRILLTVDDGRILTTAIFIALWLLSIAALLVAAFQPDLGMRLLWALPIAAASASAYGFYRIQQSEFTVIDVMSFWAARHELWRAGEFYRTTAASTLLVALTGLVAIAMPPAPMRAGVRIWLRRLVWLPCLPIVLIAGVVIWREGKGSYNLPKQFSPLSLAAVAALKTHGGISTERQAVGMRPGPSRSRAIVVFVDESVRADHVSLRPHNPFTPALAAQRDRWINFGPAVSGGNCSNISNALLRFVADPRHLKHSTRSNPTIWQYAKSAGYRTVYIDAQSGFIKEYGKLQNFMTLSETIHIDRIYKFDDSIPTHALDDHLMSIALSELKTDEKIFIYANKSGAHFPYQDAFPSDRRDLMRMPAATPVTDARMPAYVAAIRWTVDRVLSAFIERADLSDTTVIYTSDHGQHFADGRLTHCSSGDNVKPEEAMVPLMVMTGRPDLAERFREVAVARHDLATHFAIAPALLELMGYPVADIREKYDGSLLGTLPRNPAFVSGDIFGIFSDDVSWHPVTTSEASAQERADLRVTRGEPLPEARR